MKEQIFKNLTLAEIELAEQVIRENDYLWNGTVLKNVEIAIAQELNYLIGDKEILELHQLAKIICE